MPRVENGPALLGSADTGNALAVGHCANLQSAGNRNGLRGVGEVVAAAELEADFRAFVAARQDRLLRSAWLLTGDWAAAEDLVQTALSRAWPHWGRLMGTASADAYVRTVLLNSFRKAWRRHWSAEVPTASLPDHGAASGDVDGRLGMRRALAELPPRQRAVVVLRYFEELTVAETAAALGVADGTVKSQTAKALMHLRVSAHLDRSEP